MESYVAVDLGAGSGRVVLGHFGRESLDLEVLHRFGNEIESSSGHERWNTAALFEGIKTGLARLPDSGRGVVSVGVDTWAVDYGLFDSGGTLLEEPICYRDGRTRDIAERVFEIVPRDELFARTGIAFQPFNTVYQLFAHVHGGEFPREAARLLMMPDIFHFFLSGEMAGEQTNASTTQLLSARSGDWDRELVRALRLPGEILPPLSAPGTRIGTLRQKLALELGLPALSVVAPGSHDTASAVAATPLEEGWAYVSSGTWSLVGVETGKPVITPEAARENFTNERGVCGSNRFLKNVSGLWILEGCLRSWRAGGGPLSYEEVVTGVGSAPPFAGFLFPDDARFFRPADMVAAVCDFLKDTGQPVVVDPICLARLVLESLALRCASVLRRLEAVTGMRLRGIRIIGGGSRNDFLNQATADATGLPVLAGPVEATAVGNLLIQAIAGGRWNGLPEARRFVDRSLPARKFAPDDRAAAAWRAARSAYARLTGDRANP